MRDSKFFRYFIDGDTPVRSNHVIHLPDICICSGRACPSSSRYVLYLLTSINECATPSPHHLLRHHTWPIDFHEAVMNFYS
ncbi:hypothetical protein TNCT_329891 [Trichonephila clavata]|uniref:Uncharacterized protein n=1 Tax=Trichonephila clavata TaxID=2740835 RepID=A0A8X6JRX4_TRICU|nr:hypothetical protein TNCT_329891 [Trichonephila clavata]